MARKWTGLKNPLVTPDANLLFDFPNLNLAEVDNVEVPYDPSGDGIREITAWLAAMSLTIIKPNDPWTGENQTKVTVEYGRRIYSFVNPQHALMFKLAFGRKQFTRYWRTDKTVTFNANSKYWVTPHNSDGVISEGLRNR